MKSDVFKRGKIAHIIVDDKFIDMALRQCDEVCQHQNIPIMIGSSRILRYVNREDVKFYSVRQAKTFFSSNECVAVIFHSITDGFLPLLRYIPAGKVVIWLGWGYDYYDRLLSGFYPDGLLLPQTKDMMREFKLLRVMKSLRSTCKNVIKRALLCSGKSFYEMISRVDYFSPVLDVEYLMVLQANSSFKPKYICWNYGTLEDDYCGICTNIVSGRNNILVGNSAAPENNHIELFNILRDNVDLYARKVIVPLSYGNELYREKVIAVGEKMFGDSFVPLVNFLAKDAYEKLLDSCGYVLMNHLRQQGMGNILIMLMKGAKVFMNPQSPAFGWLVSKGVEIHSIKELEGYQISSAVNLMPISKEAHEMNVSILKNYWGKSAQYEKTYNLIEIALGHKIVG